MWETIKNAGILMIALVLAFFMGILLSSLFYRRRMRRSFIKKKKVAGFMPEIQEELWELIIQACVSDLRFLAMLGYDPDIRDVLEDPVLMDSKYLEESPLLPGEIALVVVNDKKSYLQNWDEIYGQSTDIVAKMQPDKSILFTQLALDFKQALSEQSDDEVYYFLYLQTPKTLCIVVLNMTFSKVLAVTPVISELHTQVIDILGDSVIKSAEDFEKMKKLAV